MLNSDVLFNITLFWENGVLQGQHYMNDNNDNRFINSPHHRLSNTSRIEWKATIQLGRNRVWDVVEVQFGCRVAWR